MSLFIIVGSLVCGLVGWKIWRSAMKLGRDVVAVGIPHSLTAGGMQLGSLLLAVPLLLICVVGVPAGVWDVVESQVKAEEYRQDALRHLASSKKNYEELSAKLARSKSTPSPQDKQKIEQYLASAKWYANRSEAEVIAEADELMPKTLVRSFLEGERKIDAYNESVKYAQIKRHIEAKKLSLATE